jgi:DNA-binding NtrC family response regulator
VRELRNVLERATILARGDEIGVDLLLLGAPPPAAAAAGSDEGDRSLEEMERRHIEQMLERTGRRIYGAGGAAEKLGLPPSTLRSRMSKLGIAGAREFRKRGGAA